MFSKNYCLYLQRQKMQANTFLSKVAYNVAYYTISHARRFSLDRLKVIM
jgi:hypothetical protein